jgi:hypothetical protein
LTRPEEDKKSPEDSLKFKPLSTQAKTKDSPKYKVVVNVFHNGTPKKYIKVIIATDKVFKQWSKYFPVQKTNGHDAKECKVLLTQVKKVSVLYESMTSFHNNKCQKTDYHKSKPKKMFSFMVKAFKASNCKKE